MFDSFYISFLNLLKPKFGKRAMSLALYYICLIEIAFYGLLATFFAAFANQMNLGNVSPSKAITLSILVGLFICLKNWMRYNGKRRNVLNAKSKKHKLPLWKLIVLPLVCVVLAIVFFQAL
jgi:hypothetical protein